MPPRYDAGREPCPLGQWGWGQGCSHGGCPSLEPGTREAADPHRGGTWGGAAGCSPPFPSPPRAVADEGAAAGAVRGQREPAGTAGAALAGEAAEEG